LHDACHPNHRPPLLTVARPALRLAAFRAGKALVLLLALSQLGCSELRARQLGREGNRHFKEGDYRAAADAYSASEQLHPLAVVALNKGLACRQLLLPGAKSAEVERAADCALKAFRKLKELSPGDSRADQLYQQTLFDADRFEELVRLYEKQLAATPDDPAAINGLIQVYTRWDRWDDALRWMVERTKRRPADPEAHYAVGVFIYNRLFAKGGGPEKSSFDPRPGLEPKQPPAFGAGDITGKERVALADQAIFELKRALELRPTYTEAMTYLGLVYRQQSFAYFDQPAAWQASVDSAEALRRQAAARNEPHAAPAASP
jgi:tetratricopeptide (TPR) repeat protein